MVAGLHEQQQDLLVDVLERLRELATLLLDLLQLDLVLVLLFF